MRSVKKVFWRDSCSVRADSEKAWERVRRIRAWSASFDTRECTHIRTLLKLGKVREERLTNYIRDSILDIDIRIFGNHLLSLSLAINIYKSLLSEIQMR